MIQKLCGQATFSRGLVGLQGPPLRPLGSTAREHRVTWAVAGVQVCLAPLDAVTLVAALRMRVLTLQAVPTRLPGALPCCPLPLQPVCQWGLERPAAASSRCGDPPSLALRDARRSRGTCSTRHFLGAHR